MSFEIDDIKRIRTQPGDVLLIKLPVEMLDDDTTDTIRKVSEIFNDCNVKLLFHHNSLDISIISTERVNFEF